MQPPGAGVPDPKTRAQPPHTLPRGGWRVCSGRGRWPVPVGPGRNSSLGPAVRETREPLAPPSGPEEVAAPGGSLGTHRGHLPSR